MFLGIALHDTKLDTMTKFMIAVPIAMTTFEAAHLTLGGDSHTHVERVSASQFANRSTSLNPKLPSRLEKKYHLTSSVQKGHHPFDNYMLPVLA